MLTYNVRQSSVDTILDTLHKALFPEVNVVLFCRDYSLAIAIIHKASVYDEEHQHSTDLRHHSEWLVSDSSDMNLRRMLNPKKIYLENLAIFDSGFENQNGSLCGVCTLSGVGENAVFVPGTTSTKAGIFPNSMYGYNRRKIRVSSINSAPYSFRNPNPESDTDVFIGFSIDLLKLIAKELNFTYEFVEPPEEEWGFFVNGSWTGVVGQLERREIDFAVADLTVHQERSKVMDFMEPVLVYDALDTFFKKVSTSSYQWTMLSDIVDLSSLCAIFALALTLPVFYTFLEIFVTWPPKAEKIKLARSFKYWMDIYSFVIGSMFKQAVTIRPRRASSKILVSAWWLFVIVIVATYTAHFVAILSAPQVRKPFSTLKELTERDDYVIGAYNLGIARDILQKSTRPDVKVLWDRLLKREKVDARTFSEDIEWHFDKTLTSKYAFIGYRAVNLPYMASDCTLDTLGDALTWEQLTFGVPKNSPLKKDLEEVVWTLAESGLTSRLWARWTNQSHTIIDTDCNVHERATTIRLEQLGGGLIMVCVGLFVAAMSLLVERFHCRRKVKRKSDTSDKAKQNSNQNSTAKQPLDEQR